MSGVLDWARLSFRLQRLEISIIAVAVIVASGLMLWLAFDFDGLQAAYPTCDWFDARGDCLSAAQRYLAIYASAELFMNNMWLVGFAFGLVVGVPLVAREVEHGTAQLAWTIGRSRVRWLVGRVAFAVLVLFVLLGTLAVVTEVLATAMTYEFDPSENFWLVGNRGPLIVGRGMLGLGAGVLVGALLGKQLPALLLGIIVVGGLYWASIVGLHRWYESEAVVASMNEFLGGPLWLDSGIELASGERVSWGEMLASGETAVPEWMDEEGALYATQADFEARRDPIGREYVLIIPGERYPEIVARETAVLFGAGLVLVGAAAAVTQRRRPT